MIITLDQAVIDAIAAEQAAWSFYMQLATRCEDPDARAFLEDMAAVEAIHAAALERFGRKLRKGGVQGVPSGGVELVETAPSWMALQQEVESMDIETALAIAEVAEQHAATYYEALADMTTGAAQVFFMGLAKEERRHLRHIEDLVEEAAA